MQIQLLTKMLEIVLTPEILGPPKIGGPRFKPFKPDGKSAPVFATFVQGVIHE